jgi:hypothetical protein
MSAASFLGISGLVFANGFDGLIFSIGWLVGWPVITFLMAERLRNLGKFTFADVASYRFAQTPVRIFAASASLVIVAFYMIAQMVGAGQLIKMLFGMEYLYAEILVGSVMMMYVLFGGMTATTWVQIIKAVMLLGGATFMAVSVLLQFGFSPEALFAKAVEVHPKHDAIMSPGALIKDPVSAISVGMALMFGTAGLPHILMRFFTVPNAKEARKSVAWATTWIGYFYILTFIIGFGAITNLIPNPSEFYVGGELAKGLKGGGNMAAVHLAKAVGGDLFLGFISAVAFATILAVVAGLTLSGASAVSHDLYASVFAKGCSFRVRTARFQDHHGLPRHPGSGSRYRLREGKRRLHGDAGLRHRLFVQLPGALHVRAVEELHDPWRRRRWLRRPGSGGDPDHRFRQRLGSRHGQSEGFRLVPVQLRCHLLDDCCLRHDLAGVHPGQLCPGQEGACAVPGAAAAFGNRSRCFRRLRPLSRPQAVMQKARVSTRAFFRPIFARFKRLTATGSARARTRAAFRQLADGEFARLAGLLGEKTVGGTQCRIGPPPESRRKPQTPKTIKGEQPAQNNAVGLQNSYAGMGA